MGESNPLFPSAQTDCFTKKSSLDHDEHTDNLNELTENNDHVGSPVDESPEHDQTSDHETSDGTNMTESNSVNEYGGTISSRDSRSIRSTYDINPLWVDTSYRNSRSDNESLHIPSNNI